MNAKSQFSVFLLVVTAIPLLGSTLACNLSSASPSSTSGIPTGTAVAVPTTVPTIPPSATVTPTIGATSPLTATMTPVAEEMKSPSAPVVVQQAEGTGGFAIAVLAGVQLEAGRQYALQVTSRAGSVAFHGTHGGATIIGEGAPGVSVELLDAVTPVTYPIAPSAETGARWTMSVSVQNKGSGGIIVSILDITEE